MATVTPVRQYQVLITPLVSRDQYGTELDVTKDIDLSDYIKEGGIGTIKQDIDNGDYDVGVFTYGSITMRAFNLD
jgi:putative ubiquitin-RnfH superfamily antitoxin RatB of RatAB toxin-antitoxin module